MLSKDPLYHIAKMTFIPHSTVLCCCSSSSSSFCPELSASCLEREPTNECSETSGAESLESKDKDPISA